MSQLPFEGFKVVSADKRSAPIELRICCRPPTATHQDKDIVKRWIGKGAMRKMVATLADSQNLVEARDTWKTLLLPHQPRAPMPGPVSLRLEFTFPWRAGDGPKVRAAGRIWKSTKPDCSNMAKTVEDVLALLRFIENDAEVAELVVRKFHGDKPGLAVRIAPIDDGEHDL